MVQVQFIEQTDERFDEQPPINKFERIIDDLATHGLSVYDNFISPELVHALSREARNLWQEGEFREARVGKGETLKLRTDIRSDNIHWLNPESPSAIHRPHFEELDTLRAYINRSLFLGLFEYEGHYALYPPGASYKTHYDRFIGAHQRVVTAILYLNDQWKPEQGGALRVYQGNSPTTLELPMDVYPLGGRLVTFISEEFPHEVLAANRDRLSLTGWFRIRE